MEDDTPYDLVMAYESESRLSDESVVRRSVQTALEQHHVKRAFISLVLVDDARIASLNGEYLGHSGSTDVITFNLCSDIPHAHAKNDFSVIDGELVLSIETATRESKSRSHSLDAEVALYAVHGTLHLLGYDDKTDEDAQRMHAMENEILTSIGMDSIFRGQAL